ncbi:MAG: hypothetical protein IKY94_04870 [Lachnospiraceae bacterium]|nr:hypothetical protein [Lachnospiraceae bacterium]
MNQELAFAKKLEEIRKLAKEQGNMLSQEQVEEAFAEIDISKEQLEPVFAYLKSKNIGIGEPIDMEEVLTQEDKDYLAEYLEALTELPVLSEGEKRAYAMAAIAGETNGKLNIINSFLPQVVDIAKLYSGQGVLLEDLIGEGNVALATGVEMLGCLEDPEEIDGMLGKMIMDAMEDYISENSEAKKADMQIVDKVNSISDQAKELAESLQRKISVEELAAETGLDEEEIREAIKFSGNKIEFFE